MPKPPTLGDNLNIRFRDGMTTVFFNVGQVRATKAVIHLMQAVARVQPLDKEITTAAEEAITALEAVLANTQPLLPSVETEE